MVGKVNGVIEQSTVGVLTSLLGGVLPLTTVALNDNFVSIYGRCNILAPVQSIG